jgi:hypothetical protein
MLKLREKFTFIVTLKYNGYLQGFPIRPTTPWPREQQSGEGGLYTEV